ncbi:MAG: DUF664 domain-containing protein [Actinomycetota bacterium]
MDAHLPPSESGEWHHLNGFLDHLRHTVESQASGLGDSDLARKVGTVSIGGILTHLAFIEDYWFGYVWTGREPSEPWLSAPWDDDPDADWGMAAGRTGREILALWRAAVDRSRREAVRGPLDCVSARDTADGPVAKRWILLHMLEEYARHAGQADMLLALAARRSASESSISA